MVHYISLFRTTELSCLSDPSLSSLHVDSILRLSPHLEPQSTWNLFGGGVNRARFPSVPADPADPADQCHWLERLSSAFSHCMFVSLSLYHGTSVSHLCLCPCHTDWIAHTFWQIGVLTWFFLSGMSCLHLAWWIFHIHFKISLSVGVNLQINLGRIDKLLSVQVHKYNASL